MRSPAARAPPDRRRFDDAVPWGKRLKMPGRLRDANLASETAVRGSRRGAYSYSSGSLMTAGSLSSASSSFSSSSSFGSRDGIMLATDPDPVLIQPAKIENNRTIEIDRFVASEQNDWAYFQTPYYIAPRGAIGEEAFAVIRDTLREKKVFAMGRVVLARRERPIIIEPLGLGLRGVTLRFAHEIRDPVEYFREIPELRLPQEMLRIAEHIVDAKMSAFDTAYLEDRYRTAVLSKLKERHDTSWKVGAVTPSQENIINLMDALKRSLGSEKMPPKPSARQRGAKMSKNQGSKLGKR
jgi:Ku protein